MTIDGDGPRAAAARRHRGRGVDISEALDASPAVGNAPYTLEVSSRGVVSKPLTEASALHAATAAGS